MAVDSKKHHPSKQGAKGFAIESFENAKKIISFGGYKPLKDKPCASNLGQRRHNIDKLATGSLMGMQVFALATVGAMAVDEFTRDDVIQDTYRDVIEDVSIDDGVLVTPHYTALNVEGQHLIFENVLGEAGITGDLNFMRLNLVDNASNASIIAFEQSMYYQNLAEVRALEIAQGREIDNDTGSYAIAIGTMSTPYSYEINADEGLYANTRMIDVSDEQMSVEELEQRAQEWNAISRDLATTSYIEATVPPDNVTITGYAWTIASTEPITIEANFFESTIEDAGMGVSIAGIFVGSYLSFLGIAGIGGVGMTAVQRRRAHHKTKAQPKPKL